MTGANIVDAVSAGAPAERESRALASLVPDVLAGMPADRAAGRNGSTGAVEVYPTSFGAMLYMPGLVLELERNGVDARMPGSTDAAGAHRSLGDTQPATTLVVAVNDDILPYLDDPSTELLASWGDPPRPPPADDPVAAAEAAFSSNDIDAMKDLGRRYRDDDLPEPFDIVAVAVFARS